MPKNNSAHQDPKKHIERLEIKDVTRPVLLHVMIMSSTYKKMYVMSLPMFLMKRDVSAAN